LENAISYLNEGASHVIVTSVRAHALICVNYIILLLLRFVTSCIDVFVSCTFTNHPHYFSWPSFCHHILAIPSMPMCFASLLSRFKFHLDEHMLICSHIAAVDECVTTILGQPCDKLLVMPLPDWACQ